MPAAVEGRQKSHCKRMRWKNVRASKKKKTLFVGITNRNKHMRGRRWGVRYCKCQIFPNILNGLKTFFSITTIYSLWYCLVLVVLSSDGVYTTPLFQQKSLHFSRYLAIFLRWFIAVHLIHTKHKLYQPGRERLNEKLLEELFHLGVLFKWCAILSKCWKFFKILQFFIRKSLIN